jgi:uncharacterized membrane protein YoaK (UPF0700 family)
MQPPAPLRQQATLVFALAMIAGYVDGYGLLAFSTFLSFMSGNTTQTGSNLGRADLALALPSAVAIGAFLLGIFTGNLRSATPPNTRTHDRLLLTAVGLMLAAACTGLWLRWFTQIPSIALIAFAMGIMNTTLSRIGNEPVNLTFVTGTLNKIGTHLAMAAKGEPLTDAEGTRDTHISRALLLTAVWASFLIGAILAGAATATLQEWTLLPAAGALMVAAAAVRG